MKYYVEVVADKGNEVVKRLGPMSEQKAEKVCGGLDMRIDHDNYYTRIVEKESNPS